MKNKKLEKLEEDIYKAIDEADGVPFEGCWHIDENDLKERIRFLFWEVEMSENNIEKEKMITIEVSKEDLVNLITGTSPSFDLINPFTEMGIGNYIG